MENIPTYIVDYTNEQDGDLYAISIVDSPANGFQFIAMTETIEKVEVKLASDVKKQILYGIVLRPEQKIYREFEDGTPFNLVFDAKTIEKLSQDFMRKSYQNNSTFNHDRSLQLEDATVVEQWIVLDKQNDKGNTIGLPVENGDWVIGMKLSDSSWNSYVETGLAKGFSIDSFIDIKKLNKSVDYNITKSRKNKKENMSLIKQIIKLFSEDVKLASLDTNVGLLTADAFEIGNVVYDDQLQPVVDAEFTADGKSYCTDSLGSITEVAVVETELSTELTSELEVVAELETIEAEETITLATLTTNELGDLTADAFELGNIVYDVTGLPVVGVEFTAENKKYTTDASGVIIDVVDLLSAALSEKLELEMKLEKLTKELEVVFTENVELKALQTQRLKAEKSNDKSQTQINFKEKQSTESVLDALSRINKKIKQ
jgi:hypothetical protein